MPSRTSICIVILAFLIFWTVGAYNRLVRLKNVIASAFGQVDVQLKRRYDLIPNLVEAAEKYLQHERETLDAVISMRNQARTASEAVRSRPANARAVNALSAAEQALEGSLRLFFAVAEAYPELKADDTLKNLREEQANTDNKLAFARQAYNDAALDYNKARSQFPALVVAKVFGFTPSAMLQATKGVQESKQVRIQN